MKKILNKDSAGFTLVELLITITLGITLATVGFTNYQGFKARKDVELTTAEVASAIENVRQRSITQEDGSAWGIRFNSVADGQDSYEVFKGTTYTTSSVVSLSPLRGAIEFSDPSGGSFIDVVFLPITGRVSSSETISISRTTGTNDVGSITISDLGRITQDIVSN